MSLITYNICGDPDVEKEIRMWFEIGDPAYHNCVSRELSSTFVENVIQNLQNPDSTIIKYLLSKNLNFGMFTCYSNMIKYLKETLLNVEHERSAFLEKALGYLLRPIKYEFEETSGWGERVLESIDPEDKGRYDRSCYSLFINNRANYEMNCKIYEAFCILGDNII